MPRPRFYNLEPQKRRAILDSAGAEFAAEGFSKASFNRIIEKAGISKGAMYYYFDDKADLYATVLKEAFERFFEGKVLRIPQVSTAEEFVAEVESYLHKVISYAHSHPLDIALFRRLLNEPVPQSDPQGESVLAAMRAQAERFTGEMIRAGQRVGAVRTDIDFELLVELARALDEVGDSWFAAHGDTDERGFQQWVEIMLDFQLRLLLAPGPLAQRCKIKSNENRKL